MRLIGSKTEQDFRRQLIKSHEALFTEITGSRTKLEILQSNFSNLVTAYSLGWIPEQGEDIVTYLINTDLVAVVETDRHDLSIEPIIETMTVSEYVIGLSKIKRIKLAVALDLARDDMRRNNRG